MNLTLLFVSALLLQSPAPKPATAPAASTRGTTKAPAATAPKPAAPAATTNRPATPSAAAPKPAATPPARPALTTDEQKAIYALGLSVHASLRPFALSPEELELFKRAVSDAAAGNPAANLADLEATIEPLARGRAPILLAREKAAAKAYVDKVVATPGAVTKPSGLIYRETTAGTGASPVASDVVRVHYRGTLIDGAEFDSSYKRNQPASFPLGGVIKCWTEGVQLMKVGGKATLVCPSDIAYGDGGRPGIPGGATLTFEIELLGIGGN
jgi:FKBP-type peptidyl-prolyl cis-trans isomerase FkpA